MEKPKIKIYTSYKAEIFFDVFNEVNFKQVIRQALGVIGSDKADWLFTSGTCASNPYITIEGSSKSAVTKLADRILTLCWAEGVMPKYKCQ